MIQIKTYMKNTTWLSEQGYTKEEEADIYDRQLDDIMANPRWYLDNLEKLNEYKVSWNCYKKMKGGRHNITTPYELVNKIGPKNKI